MSKKARRQLHNAQNEKSNMAQTHSSDNNRKEQFSDVRNQELCISALRCLQEILLSVGNFIKPTILKVNNCRNYFNNVRFVKFFHGSIIIIIISLAFEIVYLTSFLYLKCL